jgi:hypothetical protein
VGSVNPDDKQPLSNPQGGLIKRFFKGRVVVMITQIKTYSKSSMEHLIRHGFIDPFLRAFDGFYIISINDSRSEPVFEKSNGKILSLTFDDVRSEDGIDAVAAEKCGVVLFTKKHIDAIDKFIDAVRDAPGNNALLVQCFAGMKRSGAVAVFACAKLGINQYDFILGNRRIKPSGHLLRMLGVEAVWKEINRIGLDFDNGHHTTREYRVKACALETTTFE